MSGTEKNNPIIVFGRADEGDWPDQSGEVERSYFSPRKSADTKYGTGSIDPDVFQERLLAFLGSMDKALQKSPPTVGGFLVDSMSITLEVSAKGSISLLGTGGETGAKGGITFVLKRK